MTQTKRDSPLPPGWELGVGGKTPPRKRICIPLTSEIHLMGLTNRRQPGCKEKELIFGTWNVRTLFKPKALLSLIPQLKEYRLATMALHETRWQGKT